MMATTAAAAAAAPTAGDEHGNDGAHGEGRGAHSEGQEQDADAEQAARTAAVFRRLHPRAYLARFVRAGVRPDGRAAGEGREVAVNCGSIATADGSALVRLGGTTVVCGVKAEIAAPALEDEGAGFVVPNVDLPAMCSPRFRPGPPSDEAQVLAERLNQALVASGLVPLAPLCIARGKAAWVLYVDATCINYDGNVFDAALLAMVAALRNTTLPQATYDEATQRTTCSSKAPRVPLQLGPSLPIGVSFGVFDGQYVLADPTAFEEPLLEGRVCAVVGAGGGVVSLAQTGAVLVAGEEGGAGRDVLEECVQAAVRRRAEVVQAAFGCAD